MTIEKVEAKLWVNIKNIIWNQNPTFIAGGFQDFMQNYARDMTDFDRL